MGSARIANMAELLRKYDDDGPHSPILILAEQVADEGHVLVSCDPQDINDDFEESDGNTWYDDDDIYNYYNNSYDHEKFSVGSNTRGLYCLSTRKIYTIELPEASGKLIVGTNKGWLLTLGRDMQINLLHPLTRQQIPLPPMNTFPNRHVYEVEDEDGTYYELFIEKVAMSSRIKLVKDDDGDVNFIQTTHDTTLSSPSSSSSSVPVIMAVYGETRNLGFARIGVDKVWTKVDAADAKSFQDTTYYNGKFYAVRWDGVVYVCDIIDDDDNGGRRVKGRKIATCPHPPSSEGGYDQHNYLVESTAGELLLVLRFLKLKFYKPPYHYNIRYRTTDFLIWKLEPQYSDDHPTEILSYTCIPKENLRNEALFIGRAASISLPSSEYIESNCIYFTDDSVELHYHKGGGHDMGIFDVEKRTVKPLLQEKSLHPIAPPLWYI